MTTTATRLPAAQPSPVILPSDVSTPPVTSDDGRQAVFSGSIIVPARLVRAPLSDLHGGYDADAWTCASGHTFFVAVDSDPLACPTCEHAQPVPSRKCTGCGEVHPRLADETETFVCVACRENGDIPPLSTSICCLCDTPLAYPGAPCGECTSGQCIYCLSGGHPTWHCPRIAEERVKQEQLSHDGRGVWNFFCEDRPLLLVALRNTDTSDREAMAESLAFYLSEKTNTELTAAAVIGCWERLLAAMEITAAD